MALGPALQKGFGFARGPVVDGHLESLGGHVHDQVLAHNGEPCDPDLCMFFMIVFLSLIFDNFAADHLRCLIDGNDQPPERLLHGLQLALEQRIRSCTDDFLLLIRSCSSSNDPLR